MLTRRKAGRALPIWQEASEAILPPPRLTVSQWADANRVLDNTSPEPGTWRTDRTPFLREIMDSLSPSAPCERVVLMKSAQVGGTEVLLNVLGYLMHHAPAPTLLVQPSVEMAKRFSKQRLDSLIQASPVLRNPRGTPEKRPMRDTSKPANRIRQDKVVITHDG